ncbi:hypothetical protein CWE13_11515 [Aliidiomarina shirensis]|uniref:Uncharacterized protein n=1 Tax=Aliidiomarina shirensis TaxID=1048642 RepID=A0A432WP24_9GAMM|nr:hypothetical protein [Aliidiomarina shirensis]RUO35550.1 hypothetical protein CWE13_11515 [Aliidiomarina shirensis]
MAQNLFFLLIVVIVIVVLARRLLKMNASGHAESDASAAKIQAEVNEKEAEIKEDSARLAKEAKSVTEDAVETGKEAVESGKEAVASKVSEKKPAVKKPAAKKSPAPKTGVPKDVDPVIDSANKSQPSPIGAEVPDELTQPVAELEKTKDPLARHRLYQQITENSYKNRNDAGWRQISKTFSKQHIAEFPDIVKPLKKANGGSLPQVLTFQNYATLLAEDGQYTDAIAVCERALEFGLDDKTKTGFSGRLERIRKQQEKAAQ